MQKKINDIISKANGNTALPSNNATASQENVADELKKYKQLLDDGAMTQEEYDAVKAEYLKEFMKK